jgi:hypothetical protein
MSEIFWKQNNFMRPSSQFMVELCGLFQYFYVVIRNPSHISISPV